MSARTRLSAILALALFSAAAFACSGRAWCGDISGSKLALATVNLPRRVAAAESNSGHFSTGVAPQLLAQRVLTREWGESDDSTYVEIEVPGYQSEGLAMALSAAVPGAGQWYAGEGSALWFALAEVAAWACRWSFNDRARDFQDQALKFAGSPYDSTSNWSFSRYANSTGNPDTLALQQLFNGDRDAFYHRAAPASRAIATPATTSSQ